MVFRRTTKSSKRFYLRMKLLDRHGNFCYRYIRWVLCLSLSLYFISSYLISSSTTPTSLHKATVSTLRTSSSVSRALFETNTTDLQQPKSQKPILSRGVFNDLKVYIYDLPPKYNSDWLANERCSKHLFAAEVAIHKALLSGDVRTLDPSEADFFFVPVYVSCNFSSQNGFPAIGQARPLLASAVRLISSELPFWNRSGGADHVFVASHDYGACFHAMEDEAIADGIPEFLKRSIILQTFGVRYRHPCQAVENVLIPPYVSPESVQSTLERAPESGKRDIWVYFRGKMEAHPKNASGHFYSKRVRTVIWQKYHRNRKFYLKRQRYDGYQSEIVRSVFCLCPLGWAPWSPRLVESVALGCIPVIIADGIQFPFADVVRWSQISLTVAEKDVGKKLGRILEHVVATNLSGIQRNLWDPEIRRALLFNHKIQVGDATWQVLDALSRKLDKSYRSSRLLGQRRFDT
ncbi:probable glucuronoxylan glucuronosyltransferase IRX7 [Telopea speciosissima]|uniref:probable glucuronoxylan glucuronosyltransferase IRX7 n=1 Tax=Telopea speciosissima TaxID=54955 RepID=UPI001CC6C74F|nr:probable glucuronoxylan glucuronosyltransferase IRX7 [Telopea speciosissima]